eukprot:TRINITY_DN11160_c0_g1_i1.p1 TRINITY_DN11160_c0_g1~~TRINITY_DN11160_c0_g1_i1.p1  ORF type:complete len:291 (-),score=70.93 TRINITY_DN11160_c0_g1_i1:277-1149(-)
MAYEVADDDILVEYEFDEAVFEPEELVEEHEVFELEYAPPSPERSDASHVPLISTMDITFSDLRFDKPPHGGSGLSSLMEEVSLDDIDAAIDAGNRHVKQEKKNSNIAAKEVHRVEEELRLSERDEEEARVVVAAPTVVKEEITLSEDMAKSLGWKDSSSYSSGAQREALRAQDIEAGVIKIDSTCKFYSDCLNELTPIVLSLNKTDFRAAVKKVADAHRTFTQQIEVIPPLKTKLAEYSTALAKLLKVAQLIVFSEPSIKDKYSAIVEGVLALLKNLWFPALKYVRANG